MRSATGPRRANLSGIDDRADCCDLPVCDVEPEDADESLLSIENERIPAAFLLLPPQLLQTLSSSAPCWGVSYLEDKSAGRFVTLSRGVRSETLHAVRPGLRKLNGVGCVDVQTGVIT